MRCENRANKKGQRYDLNLRDSIFIYGKTTTNVYLGNDLVIAKVYFQVYDIANNGYFQEVHIKAFG